jgi:hypothetical protein
MEGISIARWVLVMVGAAAAAACVPMPQQRPVTISSQFDRESARLLMEKGPNSIKGSALIRQNGGGVVTCAGGEVDLVPGTAYAEERVSAVYGNNQRGYTPAFMAPKLPAEASDYSLLMLRTRCDAQGSFKFENVANGLFYVVTMITWHVGNSSQGGYLMERVRVDNGQVVELVLTP